jgi:amino acid transporter
LQRRTGGRSALNQQDGQATSLKRSIGLAGLVFYGVGTMIGGGIYALLGKIIGAVGVFTPLALLLAGAVALVSAFSFAELSRRFPVSAGEAAYVEAAFDKQWLSKLVGFLVVSTGVVSAATLCSATGGFLLDLTALPVVGLIVFTGLALTAIAAWGVTVSVAAVALVTLLEAGTLLVIIALSADRLAQLPSLVTDMATSLGQFEVTALMTATFLAFYAFVGFEDMVNMAEEVRDVERNMPLAIFIAVAITVTLYLGVAVVAITLEDRAGLVAAHTPLALLLPGGTSVLLIGVISILAGLNGALVQMIMASRVLYGMAGRGMAPRLLGGVNVRTRTPLAATLLVGATVMLLATSFPLAGLAEATSFIILGVFFLVNLSLVMIRWREWRGPRGARFPWLSALAAVSCLSMLLLRLLR